MNFSSSSVIVFLFVGQATCRRCTWLFMLQHQWIFAVAGCSSADLSSVSLSALCFKSRESYVYDALLTS